jgi:hypothetical protein
MSVGTEKYIVVNHISQETHGKEHRGTENDTGFTKAHIRSKCREIPGGSGEIRLAGDTSKAGEHNFIHVNIIR